MMKKIEESEEYGKKKKDNTTLFCKEDSQEDKLKKPKRT
jgi:hypothetical protein